MQVRSTDHSFSRALAHAAMFSGLQGGWDPLLRYAVGLLGSITTSILFFSARSVWDKCTTVATANTLILIIPLGHFFAHPLYHVE